MHLLNKLVVAALPLVPRPVVRFFAGRYIAGETLQDAVDVVRQLNAEGVCATLDVLGEDITTQEEAIAVARAVQSRSSTRSRAKSSIPISPSS